jgi:hypothetical protein
MVKEHNQVIGIQVLLVLALAAPPTPLCKQYQPEEKWPSVYINKN